MKDADVVAHNRRAWDEEVERGNPWSLPVSPERVASARRGVLSVVLTNRTPVPSSWLPPLAGLRVLALASAGGQQAPLFAAAGAEVTVFDNSPRQLAQDRAVAEREGLTLRLEEGDMADLSRFPDASFDLVFNPVSVIFVPDARRVWREAFRVLRPGGTLLAGMVNPIVFAFDHEKELDGVLEVRYALPYADTQLPPAEAARKFGEFGPLEFSHTLTDLIGGQLAAGFRLVDLYEDRFGDGSAIDRHFPGLIATRAERP